MTEITGLETTEVLLPQKYVELKNQEESPEEILRKKGTIFTIYTTFALSSIWLLVCLLTLKSRDVKEIQQSTRSQIQLVQNSMQGFEKLVITAQKHIDLTIASDNVVCLQNNCKFYQLLNLISNNSNIKINLNVPTQLKNIQHITNILQGNQRNININYFDTKQASSFLNIDDTVQCYGNFDVDFDQFNQITCEKSNQKIRHDPTQLANILLSAKSQIKLSIFNYAPNLQNKLQFKIDIILRTLMLQKQVNIQMITNELSGTQFNTLNSQNLSIKTQKHQQNQNYIIIDDEILIILPENEEIIINNNKQVINQFIDLFDEEFI